MTRQKRTARTRAMQAGRRIFRRWRAVSREGRAPGGLRFLTVYVEARWAPDLTLTVLRTQQDHRDQLVREGMLWPTDGSGIL